MITPRRRRLDIVLDPTYVADLDTAGFEELRDRRALLDEVEVELSYQRRLIHARLDLLDFELRRRAGDESRSLIEALPEILTGDDATGGGKGRSTRGDFAPPIPEQTGRREVDRALDDTFLAELPTTSDEQLAEIRSLLVETEQNVSDSRRRVHDVHDRVVAAISERYAQA